MRRLVLAVSAFSILGCPAGTGKHGPGSEANAKAAKAGEGKTAPANEPATPDAKVAKPEVKPVKPAAAVDLAKMAKVLEGAPLPITSILGKAPPDVQPLFGEPTGKGMARKSCVRYVPKRVWFECEFAYQRYADTTGKFAAIQVTYEDGLATGVGFEGPKGEGDFDPRAALKFVGLELPGEPAKKSPGENATMWTWFNSSARLVLDGKQHRVSVSTVEGKWENALVEVFVNHPLTKEQQAKVKPSGK